ncbi:MAG TPA: sigma-70 family RNA polymerase sigma factor [Coriobacteriia bacterium]
MTRAAAGDPDITALLLAWNSGDPEALNRLLPAVYAELRRLARRELQRERANHSLEPTALIHELYLGLIDQRRTKWESRAHFFAIAAQLMRRILVDHARARNALKRGGGAGVVQIDAADDAADDTPGPSHVDLLELDQALERLSARSPEQGRIVEMRFFAGLTVEETAHVLGRSPRTVKREWRLARAWLFRELRG